MSDLVVRGGIDVGGSPIDVVIRDGSIVGGDAGSADAAEQYDARGLTVLPGLLDLQVNGVAGIDLTHEPERLWEAAAALPAFGVTAFLPTVITAAPEARDRALAVLRDGPPAGWTGAVPIGLHLEGPMISVRRKGAHPERWLSPASLDLVAGWSRTSGVVMVTLAPELPGALEVVAALVERGVVVSVGHTEATADQALEAMAAGARTITHLGNAMPPLGARDPGPVGVVLGDSSIVAGVIADGHHLAPATLAAYWQALAPHRFLAVTDCTAALGMSDGPARLGDQHVVVHEGTVRLADGTLAGSSASLPQCLRVIREVTGCTLAEAVATCTSTAAAVLGDTGRGRIAVGARGDLTLVDDDLRVAATVVGGRVVFAGAR